MALWLKTGNGVQSALEAYDTTDYNSASTIATQNLQSLKLGIREYCEANKVSIKEVFDMNKKMLSATKTQPSPTEPDKDVEDWQARDKAMTRFERWLGVESVEENKPTNNTINFIFQSTYDPSKD